MRLGLELTVTLHIYINTYLFLLKIEPTHFFKSIQNYGPFDLIVIAV